MQRHTYNRGVTYGKLGNHRQAIEDFDRAIEVGTERIEPYYNRGFAYEELGDFRKAIENYDRAIEINPEDAEAYNSRGVAMANSETTGSQFRIMKGPSKSIPGLQGPLITGALPTMAWAITSRLSRIITEPSRSILTMQRHIITGVLPIANLATTGRRLKT